jgi:predicted enzyme related to lactoylglutathione lyase
MTKRTYPPGVPCWIDTEQPDVQAAIDFYGGIFGWTFEDVMPRESPDRYVIAKLDGQDVGAIAGPRRGAAVWNTYVSVNSADAAAKRLVAAGAAIRSAPADAGEGGRGAALIDPEGVEFRLWEARRRPGAQLANQPGAWNFSDLHTANVDAATAFYGQAFGWQIDDIGFGRMIRRPGYGDHLEGTIDPGIRARQSEIATPVGFEDAVGWLAPVTTGEAPHWHVTFTVADRDQTVLDAEQLGAQVLGQDDNEWTRSALIRDPQGAEFTASQFAPTGF